MDLTDSPDTMPVSSQTVVIMPENQGTITKSNGSRNVRFLIPDYVGYYQPSLSNFNFNILMKGRGNPIPSRDAGCHSLFSTVRTHDGTGSSLIEDIEQYNTYVAQKFLYSRGEGVDNGRAEFEGLNQNMTCDNNLYWALNGGVNWSGGDITEPAVPRPLQFLAPLHTELYDTSQYIPAAALGGLRLELQLENYQRALEYTCNDMAIEAVSGVGAFPLALNPGSGVPNVPAAEAAVPTFDYTTPGTLYTVNNIYEASIGGVLIGYVQVLAVDAPATGLITEASIFCLGATGGLVSTRIPVAGDVLVLGVQGAGTAASLTLLNGVNGSGTGRTGNSYQELHIPLWASGGNAKGKLVTEALALGGAGAAISPLPLPTDDNMLGDGSLKFPFQFPSPRASDAYNPTGCFPGTVMPFSIGDKLYCCNVANDTNEVACGIISGIDEYVTNLGGVGDSTKCPRLRFVNDRVVQGGLGNAAPVPTGAALQPPLWSVIYAYHHELQGLKVYVKDAERINSYAINNLPDAGSLSVLYTQAANVVDFTISNFQYQVHQMNMPSSVLDADSAAANSEKGLQIDLDTVEVRQVNLAAIQGPTSQLISVPNIVRACGCLSVPLNQNEQRGLNFSSLRGVSDQMSNYQYELGIRGLVPNRPVSVQAASLNNPLIQTQETNEKMKAMDAFGVRVSNLNQVGMNFSVGRQFSRPNMYMDLMAAGDLLLKAQFDSSQTSPKLYCHFISHLRSINVSRNGFKISN